MLRITLALCAMLALVACAGVERTPLPAELREGVSYRHDGPPALTLITVVNNRTGAGGHSSLMVSASERVIFDPAGSFRPDWVTEYGDVLYGMNDRAFLTYKRAHARASHHVVTQTIPVSPATAERALQLVEASGTVPSAYCANATSAILQQLPEFRDVRRTFYPVDLMEQVAGTPGIVTDRLFEDDDGNVVDGIVAFSEVE